MHFAANALVSESMKIRKSISQQFVNALKLADAAVECA